VGRKPREQHVTKVAQTTARFSVRSRSARGRSVSPRATAASGSPIRPATRSPGSGYPTVRCSERSAWRRPVRPRIGRSSVGSRISSDAGPRQRSL
jgi:hypothetical protein